MGDNLGDFSEIFEVDNTKERNDLVDQNKKYFGDKFIVLPNAMYGNWEGAVYDGNMRLPAAEKKKDPSSKIEGDSLKERFCCYPKLARLVFVGVELKIFINQGRK